MENPRKEIIMLNNRLKSKNSKFLRPIWARLENKLISSENYMSMYMIADYLIIYDRSKNMFTVECLTNGILVFTKEILDIPNILHKLDSYTPETTYTKVDKDIISDWIMEDHCSYKYLVGTNPNNPKNRVAFIEKTPRVFIDKKIISCEKNKPFNGGWIYGAKGDGHLCGKDPNSRKWCDNLIDLVY